MLVWAGGYLAYFAKTRLFVEGLPIERKEWMYVVMAVGGIFIGTINVRMAAARLRKQS